MPESRNRGVRSTHHSDVLVAQRQSRKWVHATRQHAQHGRLTTPKLLAQERAGVGKGRKPLERLKEGCRKTKRGEYAKSCISVDHLRV